MHSGPTDEQYAAMRERFRRDYWNRIGLRASWNDATNRFYNRHTQVLWEDWFANEMKQWHCADTEIDATAM